MRIAIVSFKNYIAVFTLSDRKDGYGVVDKNGKHKVHDYGELNIFEGHVSVNDMCEVEV